MFYLSAALSRKRKIRLTNISRRFGIWKKALLKAGLKPGNIINYSDEELFENILNIGQYKGKQPIRRALIFSLLKRDNFTCVQSGASPAKVQGVELHVDHIKPWSKGGETIYDNLQTLLRVSIKSFELPFISHF